MKARLFAKAGPMQGTELPLGEEATLGRSEDNTLVLPHKGVSARHARLSWDAERQRYLLEDLGSTNGTELDGLRISGPEPLGHLHVISLGGTCELIFQDLDRCRARQGLEARPAEPLAADIPPGERPTERVSTEGTMLDAEPVGLPSFLAPGSQPEKAPADGTMLDAEPVGLPSFLAPDPEPRKAEKAPADGTMLDAEPMGLPSFLAPGSQAEGTSEAPRWSLDVPVLRRRLPLAPGENVVGRTDSADLKIEVVEVSRRHAVLTVGADGTVRLRDLGSSNHTFLDDEKIEGEVTLEPGAALRFGSVDARLVLEAAEPKPEEE